MANFNERNQGIEEYCIVEKLEYAIDKKFDE